jgi:hypothetical protein
MSEYRTIPTPTIPIIGDSQNFFFHQFRTEVLYLIGRPTRKHAPTDNAEKNIAEIIPIVASAINPSNPQSESWTAYTI